MNGPEPNALDRRILERIQSDFPLTRAPYDHIAADLGATTEQIHDRVLALRRSGVIRRIGGSFAAAPLGYRSTLVGCRVDPGRLDAAAAVAGAFPEVTHNYEREGDCNLWFTVIAPDTARIAHILGSVRGTPGVQEVYDLPARRVFKVRVHFRFDENTAADDASADTDLPTPADPTRDPPWQPDPQPSRSLALDAFDRRLIRAACGDIGTSRDPFQALADSLASEAGELLLRLHDYLETGVMRRFGAVVRHRTAGILGNAMSVWKVPDPDVERVGRALARRPEISHCYERARVPGWPFNLFAMIHGSSRELCADAGARVAREIGRTDHRLLFSGREFKKTSMIYFPEAR
ncbi:MAG: Lrp/AsnC family transcriptional regulator [Lentisphaeria bacterium]|nr:Lrp/AsnC family transcriptional regulator [Lentisphaeria bacterium]